ncbi:amidase signature domain-containing protein [Boletus edulis BED1]|uniref:Amidase signature domain-containing protein n=1 Tax=Boletus edulis BED1 TaxID=1328754 RepID=A0AAD4BTC4_BOLED|nr:amidase signature domain-containing protein [Boletus edulis BED1]
MFPISPHRRDCAAKQQERQRQLDALPDSFSEGCTEHDNRVLDLSLRELVHDHEAGTLSTSAILQAYGKKLVSAQKATNCLAAVLLEESMSSKSPTRSGHKSSTPEPARLLSGVLVSIKDCIEVEGYDTTIGYSSRTNKPSTSSAAIVRLLRDAGAIIHAKTTTPPGLIGLETSSDLFGRTSNPYNATFVSGASTGGGAALLASRGSLIEIGTDIGGSVRWPAHCCGIYGMRSTIGRFPSLGALPPLPGLEFVGTSCSPMARRLEDLEEFWKRVVDMNPWNYDYTCVPLPWRTVDLEDRKLRWGVVWEDGIMPPSPACRRALETVLNALKKQGHEVINFTPPPIAEAFCVGLQLCFSDAGAGCFKPLRKDEKVDPAMSASKSLLEMPLFVKKLLAMFTRSLTGDDVSASFTESLHTKTAAEERALVVARDQYRAQWYDAWEAEGLDFVLTVPHPMPAIPTGTAEKVTLISAALTMICNIVDCVAGVLPVTLVNKDLDALPRDFQKSDEFKQMGAIGKGAYSIYDADAMHGLPVGVQVIGRRFEEERVLQAMKVVEHALEECGKKFTPRVF